MKYYPIHVDLRQRACLVIGNGALAHQKASALARAGAAVTVVADSPGQGLRDLANENQVKLVERAYHPDDMDGCTLVIDASEDVDLATRVSEAAMQRGILVNVVDRAELCSFIAPAIVERGDLVISVSTSGSSPALAKRIRADLERVFGMEYAEALDIFRHLRVRLQTSGVSSSRRRAIFERLAASPLCRYLRDQRIGDADRLLARIVGPEASVASLAVGTESGEAR